VRIIARSAVTARIELIPPTSPSGSASATSTWMTSWRPYDKQPSLQVPFRPCILLSSISQREFYIAVERDFDHTWRASLDERTIESFHGFDEPINLSIGPEGILTTTLQSCVPKRAQTNWRRPTMVITAQLAISFG